MEREENSANVNKSLYKTEIYLIKTLPIILAFLCFLNVLLSYFCIETPILNYIGGTSFLVLLFLYVSSLVFKFCIYHRLFIYYIITNNGLCIYDCYIGIDISDFKYLLLHCLLLFIFLCLMLYFHVNKNLA